MPANHTTEYCLDRAIQCEHLAKTTAWPNNKVILLDLAKRWRRLAAEGGTIRLVGYPQRQSTISTMTLVGCTRSGLPQEKYTV